MRGVDGASPYSISLLQKINLIYGARVGHVSDIKLIRTDTTLDLSQKAEKRYPQMVNSRNQILWRSKFDDGKLLFSSFLTLIVLVQNAIVNIAEVR